ncbi:DUF6262 family protein [Nocardia cyriacigeorgica]|uniref:DUF6262 family protein n=1 Tax=Nocardia cyriacigeorgica TaxID=135487 RepID=UPI000CEA68AD|nr:DUF6262 family protein [Nocardia cyriacigeorgica]MBF6325853.1 hypothetical protein [Nocardia cyriacigeorgica]PPJ02552.1 hypothetical protein C5E43_26440 [Nocardia cyriacigeorgica]
MTNPLITGRRADSTRRRQRVLNALDAAHSGGGEISVAAIARAAHVDRSFLYRHPDLLDQIRCAQLEPTPSGPATVTSASLKADLVNAQSRINRLTAHNKHLEKRLSELMGEQAWRDSGLGASIDIDELHRQIVTQQQQLIELGAQLEVRDQELAAARAANRELFTNLNTRQ